MTPEKIASTEATIVDLIAMRSWHFQASLDPLRVPSMRRWHRSQVDFITKKLYGEKHSQRTRLKVALVEVLANAYRTQLHERAGALEPFAWSKFCEAARKAVRKRKFEGQDIGE